jgi:probable HAF family extracellular repeat protein
MLLKSLKRSLAIGLVLAPILPILAEADPQRYRFQALEPPGSEGSEAFGVNDAGHVVGTAFEAGGNSAGFIFDGVSYTRVQVFTTDGTVLHGVNDTGQIVGQAQGTSGSFVLNGSTVDFLSAPPGAGDLSAEGINNQRQIVGTYLLGAGVHGFFRNSDGLYGQLDVPSAFNSAFTLAYGINDAGHVVGWFADSSLREHGFIYDGAAYAIFDFPGAIATEPHGIDACGRVVGRFVDSNGNVHGFLKDGKKFVTVDVPGAVMTWVNGISATTGSIVGRFINELPGTTAQSRSFVATPIHGKSLRCRPR